ncbi:sporulation control protein Spo0M [Aliivibrio fischeri]|uniref:sporulation protein n=1 Tax=Aliivibrio fischeri TaxID=668 RepID=UPI0012D9E00F|nr:sporulation protein [Aliivibrio fischeri]MUH98351.1 sporulation control protein Spo0M [Aliivibrio fischeri]MUI63616.1 sporulation control protein Spo0M [Aliivibrio fischeri]
MSFFKKTLASLGIGSANVDTIIHHEVLIPGQKAQVTIEVTGGATAQDIDNIDLKLCCQYKKEVHRKSENGSQTQIIKQTYVLADWSLPYAFTIEPKQERKFELELDLPLNTPITIGDAKVWVQTGLDISLGLDPTDKDPITVRPDDIFDGVLTALETEGLRIRQVECEHVKGFDLPFVQEFEFVPFDGPYHGSWRELEMIAHRTADELQLWFEIDRRHKGGALGLLSSMLGRGELKRKLSLPTRLTPEEAGKQVIDFLNQTT